MHHVQTSLFACTNGDRLGDHASPCYTEDDSNAMKALLQDFMCGPTDKCTQNLSFTCKKHAAELLFHDLNRGGAGNPTYIAQARSQSEIAHDLTVNLEAHGYLPDANVLPVYTFMPKMHKPTIGARFLSLSHQSVMRTAAVWCTAAMRALTQDMVEMWEELNFPPGGFNCWVLKDSAQFIPTIESYNGSRTLLQHEVPPFLWQFDFERLYTELDQEDLKAKLAEFIHRVFARHPDQILFTYSYKAHKWDVPPHADPGQRPRQGQKAFTAQSLISLINMIIDNAYIQVGGSVYKQVKGIPMGVNPACFFADFYLYTYELKFFERLLPLVLTNPTAQRVMQAFRFCGRKLDDLQTISHESLSFLQQFIYTNQEVDGVSGIYPADSIRLIPCNDSNSQKANFTDITIYPSLQDRGPLTTDLYDKRREPGFRQRLKPNKYPPADTLLSRNCKFNVFTSQFIRFTRMIGNSANFVVETANLIQVLNAIGHPEGPLLKKCWNMLLDRPWLFGVGQEQRHARKEAKGLYKLIYQRVRMGLMTCDK